MLFRSGIVACAQGLGGIILKTIGGQIISNYGFKTCWLVWAAIAVVGIPIAWFGIRQNPEELGIEAIGKLGKKKNTETEVPEVRLNGGLPAKQAYKTLAFWLLVLLVPSLTLTGTMGGYYEAFVQSKGFALAAAAAMG